MFFNQAWRCHQDFVGGVCLDGKYLTASMNYEAFHNEIDEGRADTGYGRSLPVHKCTLTAKKSYFFFDRAILCMGCDVDAHDGFSVRTVIEHRALGTCDHIIADGAQIQFTSGEISLTAKRIFIPHTGGFIFPEGAKICVRFYENGGIRFVSLWLDHGIDPEGDSYAYIILPNATDLETEAYNEHDVEILQNDSMIQSAGECSSGLYGFVFREIGEKDCVRADQPMIIMLKKDENGRILSSSACDPTQKRDSISFSLDGTSVTQNKADIFTHFASHRALP
jgi:hypothetical protein